MWLFLLVGAVFVSFGGLAMLSSRRWWSVVNGYVARYERVGGRPPSDPGSGRHLDLRIVGAVMFATGCGLLLAFTGDLIA